LLGSSKLRVNTGKKPIPIPISIPIPSGDSEVFEEGYMGFSHEKLDVYRLAIEYVRWAFMRAKKLWGIHKNARGQILGASQSIPLNIAEGNGKATENDRRHFFEIARGSALECAAIQDVLDACGALNSEENSEGKAKLDRIGAMLTKLGGRGFIVREDATMYSDLPQAESAVAVGYHLKTDIDSDTDPDSEG